MNDETITVTAEYRRTVTTHPVSEAQEMAGFDPVRTARTLLLRHGFASPPDHSRSPEAARIWRLSWGANRSAP